MCPHVHGISVAARQVDFVVVVAVAHMEIGSCGVDGGLVVGEVGREYVGGTGGVVVFIVIRVEHHRNIQ